MATDPYWAILVSGLKLKSPSYDTIFLTFLELIFNKNKMLQRKNKIEHFCVYLKENFSSDD